MKQRFMPRVKLANRFLGPRESRIKAQGVVNAINQRNGGETGKEATEPTRRYCCRGDVVFGPAAESPLQAQVEHQYRQKS